MIISIQVTTPVTLIPVWWRNETGKIKFQIYIFATVPPVQDFNCREAQHVWGGNFMKNWISSPEEQLSDSLSWYWVIKYHPCTGALYCTSC